MAGAGKLLKRALVSLLLELAHAYSLTLRLNRDSDEDEIKRGFRKVILRAHPDKQGGSEASTKRLTVAWEKWNQARMKPTDIYKNFKTKIGRVSYDYKNCGRTTVLATPMVKKFLVKKLLGLRATNIVTTALLQRELVAEMDVEMECTYIGKILKEAGYTWLPRSQKAKYTKEVMRQRLAFAEFVLSLSDRKLRERLSLSLDGVVLTVPPQDSVARENYCRYGDTHMYRKKSEACTPELAGDDPYAKQVPMNRAIPMWGGHLCRRLPRRRLPRAPQVERE